MRGRTREVREERAFGVHVGEPAMKPVRARRRVLERDANFSRGAIGARAFQTIQEVSQTRQQTVRGGGHGLGGDVLASRRDTNRRGGIVRASTPRKSPRRTVPVAPALVLESLRLRRRAGRGDAREVQRLLEKFARSASDGT